LDAVDCVVFDVDVCNADSLLDDEALDDVSDVDCSVGDVNCFSCVN